MRPPHSFETRAYFRLLTILSIAAIGPACAPGATKGDPDLRTAPPRETTWHVTSRLRPKMVLRSQIPRGSAQSVEWTFEEDSSASDQSFPEWRPTRDVANLRVERGALVFDVTGDDPSLVLQKPVSFLEWGRVEVTLQADAGTLVALLWTPAGSSAFDGNRVIAHRRSPRPGPVTYSFDLLTAPSSDLATQAIRIDPTDAQGAIRIESIKLLAAESDAVASLFEISRRGIGEEYRYGAHFAALDTAYDIPSDLPKSSTFRAHLGAPIGTNATFSIHRVDAQGLVSEAVWESVSDADEWTEALIPIAAVGGPGSRIILRAQSEVIGSPTGLASCAEVLAPEPPLAHRPNILLVVVDTLRADRLGCYGGPLGISPNIDALATQSTRFDTVTAQCTWTLPSVASYLSSRYPQELGVEWGRNYILPPDAKMLPEALADAGYSTACIFGNGILDITWGFDQGFDSFTLGPGLDLTASHITDRGIAWLKTQRANRFFLYLHYIDPHDGYEPPGSLNPFVLSPGEGISGRRIDELFRGVSALSGPEELARIQRLYNGEVFHVDQEIGRLLDWMEPEGLLHETLVVLTADHGEELHDHGGWRHGLNLYSETSRVPLLIRPPLITPNTQSKDKHLDRPVTLVNRPVMLLDLMPTVLDYANLPSPPGVRGRSLRFDIEGQQAPSSSHFGLRHSFSSTRTAGPPRASVFDGRWKLIRFLKNAPHRHTTDPIYQRMLRDYQATELYDLEADPAEEHDLAMRRPKEVERLRKELHRHAERIQDLPISSTEHALDEKTNARLRALGYAVPLKGAAPGPPPPSPDR